MLELIQKLHTILNFIKGFEVGYSSKTAKDGKVLIEYCGSRYFVKIEQVKEPSANIFDDIDQLDYFN